MHERATAKQDEAALAMGLAHAVRNPLNGAGLHLHVLERELVRMRASTPTIQEALAVIRYELGRISSCVTDFLEVARPGPLVRAPTDLDALAQAAVQRLEGAAHDRSVRLAYEPAGTPLVASVDSERIDQALRHLIQNGLDAVGPNGAVVVRARRVESDVILEVEDDGPGIPGSVTAIFDPFYTTKASGTGLGLSIVRRAMLDHGGDVTFESARGRTVFRLRAPAGNA